MKKIYKNLCYDEKEGKYWFDDGINRREVVSQESYLLIYILENIIGGKKSL